MLQVNKKNKEKKQTKSITKTSSTRTLLFKVKCLAVTQKTKKKRMKKRNQNLHWYVSHKNINSNLVFSNSRHSCVQ